MPVDWSNKDIQEWLEECRKSQEEYSKFLGRCTWIEHRPADYVFLKRKIGFALFGGPSKSDESDELAAYDEKQRKLIDRMFKLIEKTKEKHKDKQKIWVAFLYVSCKIGDNCFEVPVIHVPKYDPKSVANERIFIDSSFRVYQNWQDFLDNNMLPDCLMCYPSDGRYFKQKNKLQLGTQVSPAGRVGAKVLKGFDITNTIIQVATIGVGVASIFIPMAWPVFAGMAVSGLATGGYTAGRSIAELQDRDVHHQSIGLGNAQSRNCYLGIVSSVVGIASGGAVAAVARTAQIGESIAMGSQIAIKSITGVSCTVSSLGVVNGLANIIQKAVNRETITALDVFHVTSSVLFFANSVISTHQAHTLINKLDANKPSIVSEIENLANRTPTSARGIGTILHVENLPSTVGLGSMSSTTNIQLFKVFKSVCIKLFETARLFWGNQILLKEYKEKICIYLKMLWESWNEEINMVSEKIFEYFGKKHLAPVAMGGVRYLTGENPNFVKKCAVELISQQKMFQNVLQNHRKSNTSQNGITEEDYQASTSQNGLVQNDTEMDVEVSEEFRNLVLNISKKMADELQFQSPGEFIRYLKFTCTFIRDEFVKKKENYEKTLQMVMRYSDDVDVQTFDKEYGIQGNRNQHFLEHIMKDFNKGNGFVLLRIAYEAQKSMTVGEEVDETTVILGEDENFKAIAIENEKGLGPDGWLNRDQYLHISELLTEEEADETNVVLSESAGTAVMVIREAEKIINVTTHKQDDTKISGIAIMLDNCQ